MVLSWKRVGSLLRVGSEVLPQVEEFKYLGVLFTSDGRREREISRRTGAASAVVWNLLRSVVVKRELSQKDSYGHELWVVTERMRSKQLK